jgi:hypothetical protein
MQRIRKTLGGYSRRKVLITIIPLILIAIGGYFIISAHDVTTSQTVAGESQLCTKSVPVELAPNQAVQLLCPTNGGDWAKGSFNAAKPLTLDVSYEAPGGSQILLYNGATATNQSGSKTYSFDLPLYSDGYLIVRLQNSAQTVVSTSGSFGIYAQTSGNSFLVTKTYPYRTLGLALAVLSGLFLLILVLDPRQTVYSLVDRRS